MVNNKIRYIEFMGEADIDVRAPSAVKAPLYKKW